MFALTVQTLRILQVLVASTVTLTLFFTFSNTGSGGLQDGGLTSHTSLSEKWTKADFSPFSAGAPKPVEANATLDFQEIIYLSMPYRTDRQDALSLIAALSGLKLTMIPGVSDCTCHMPIINEQHSYKYFIGLCRSGSPKRSASPHVTRQFGRLASPGNLACPRQRLEIHHRQRHYECFDHRRRCGLGREHQKDHGATELATPLQ